MRLKSIFKSFAFASAGISSAFRNQFNMRFHAITALLVIIASSYFKISPIEWCIVLLCIGSVIAAELINTSIEINVDLAMPEHNHKAGMAKDIAAAAVLVVALISAIIGCIIFVPRIISLF